MIRFLLMSYAWLLVSLSSHGQSVNCGNIGFEEGTFAGWERWVGDVSVYRLANDYRLEPGTIHPDNGLAGHLITQLSDGNDPNVREKISVVAPGSRHSVRIGDLEAGGYVDQLRATFVVPADKPLLRYQFAIVLENPNHLVERQPGFRLLIRTMAGDTISCGYQQAIASNQAAGFQYQEHDDFYARLIYRNWTTTVLDLRAYVGQQLQLEILTHDCYEGGHMGYAYFDAQCLATTLQATTTCTPQGNRMRLNAPTGFSQYQWSTGDTTTAIQVTPQLGDKYWVDVVSQAKLNPVCRTQLRLTYTIDQLSLPTVQSVSLCAGESYQVGDSIYHTPGTYRTVIQQQASRCDSVVITHLTWRPSVSSIQQVTLCAGSQLAVGDSVYRASGTYQTRIHRAAPQCDSLVTTYLTVLAVDLPKLLDTVVVRGDSIRLTVPGFDTTLYTYHWSPSDGLSCPTCAITWASPSQTTYYQVTARTLTGNCETSQRIRVDVMPCLVALPNTFTPNGDGVNDVFTIDLTSCLGRIKQLTVYNRWGQIVFHQLTGTTSASASGWNGTYRGKEADAGVYPYRALFESPDGRINSYTGTLTLLR